MLSTNISLPLIKTSAIIGDFKGVMLCNHPFYNGSDNNKKHENNNPQNNNNKSSFICGIVPKPWGQCNNKPEDYDELKNNNHYDEEQNQLKQLRSKQILKRIQNKKGILTKHKQWLQILQKQKEECKVQNEKDKSEKEEKKRKFMEREAGKRSWVYDARNYTYNDEGEDDEHIIIHEREEEEERPFDIGFSNKVVEETEIERNSNKSYEARENNTENDLYYKSDEDTEDIVEVNDSMSKSTTKTPNNIVDYIRQKENQPVHNIKDSSISTTKTANTISKINNNKPAWAYTQSKAYQVEESIHVQEEKDLLSFVEHLDFDQYANDLEVKVLMKQLNERIGTLEKEKGKDEVQLENVLKREKEKEVIQLAKSWEESEKSKMIMKKSQCKNEEMALYDEDIMEDDDDSCINVNERRSMNDMKITANDILSSNMAQIHSHKSMEVLVVKSRKKIIEEEVDISQLRGEKSVVPPTMIRHCEDNGARLALKSSLSKLPYKNRNPCV